MARRALLAGILGVACALGAGCPSKDGGDTIRIAVVGPMSGSGAAFGEMIKKGAELKAEEINAAGGIDGKKIVLQIEDDRGDITEASNVARKLAADESIALVVGHFNSVCSIAGKEEYNRKGVVELSPGSTNINVCKDAPWTFRNLYHDGYQGKLLANYAKKLGAQTVAVLYDNDDYGKGLMNAFVEEANKIGLNVLTPVDYVRERTQDFKPKVSAAIAPAQGAVDLIFVSGLYNEAALITKSARQDLGIEAMILAGDGVMNEDFIKIAGAEAAEGVYITTPFLYDAVKDDPEAKAFYESFTKKYEGSEPDTWAALTYDALGMAAQAIDEVGTDREKIRDWFASVTTPEKAYQGVTGPTWFDAEGDCYSKGAHVALVKDGRFVAAPMQPAPVAAAVPAEQAGLPR